MIQLIPIPHGESASLTQIVDGRRREAMNKLDAEDKSAQGQFMTPRRVAGFMASLFGAQVDGDVRLLDAGAGVGSLTAAFVEEFLSHKLDIDRIAVTAYEIDSMLAEEMQDTLMECQHMCERAGTAFAAELLQQDFIEAGAHQLGRGHQLTFWYEPAHRFTHAILNPPYKKIHSESAHRRWLRSIGIETSNLYTGFLAVAIRLLEPGGELVAITPRSFCNGPYFKPFRELLLKEMSLLRIHMFESRTHAFKDDAVLQENIIFHAVKGQAQTQVTLSVSENAEFSSMQSREVDSHGKMPDAVIYLPSQNWLLLIEAVTSHGPVDGKRHSELARLFSSAQAGLIYVTAFPTRSEMARYLTEISWETDVWIADAPDHLIHFDGTRFLGPYTKIMSAS